MADNGVAGTPTPRKGGAASSKATPISKKSTQKRARSTGQNSVVDEQSDDEEQSPSKLAKNRKSAGPKAKGKAKKQGKGEDLTEDEDENIVKNEPEDFEA